MSAFLRYNGRCPAFRAAGGHRHREMRLEPLVYCAGRIDRETRGKAISWGQMFRGCEEEAIWDVRR